MGKGEAWQAKAPLRIKLCQRARHQLPKAVAQLARKVGGRLH
jgi:hypothetical protein